MREARPEGRTEHVVRNPKLVAEILSKSTRHVDRREKAMTCQRVDCIEEYGLTGQYRPRVIVHRGAEGWRPAPYSSLQAQVEFRSMRLQMALAQIYEGTNRRVMRFRGPCGALPAVASAQHAAGARPGDNDTVASTAREVPMPHTYLFQPAIWTGTGTFWCADGQPLPAEGRTEVAHRAECWLLAGTLKVLGSPPVEFVNAYQIEPPGRDGLALKWSSENATLGKLQGTFTVIGGSILSVYRCESAGYHGAEHYRRVDDDSYEATGVLLLEDRPLSSWQVLLRRTSSTASQ